MEGGLGIVEGIGDSSCIFRSTSNSCSSRRALSVIPGDFRIVLALKHWLRYLAQHCLVLSSFSSTAMRVYGLPTATTKLLALVMAVLKTLGLHRLLVELLEYPDEFSDSTVLMKRALNSLPAIRDSKCKQSSTIPSTRWWVKYLPCIR